MSCGLVEFGTGARPRAVAGDEDGGWAATAGAAAPPWTVIAVGSLCSVTYCSFAGSKYENASTGRLCLFSLGETTISKLFVPLMPTSSSCLNFEDGGYLCQPRSSSSTGAFTRSKLPARAAAIAVLNVTTSKGRPLMVSKFCDACCNFCAVNPCPVMSGGSVNLG